MTGIADQTRRELATPDPRAAAYRKAGWWRQEPLDTLILGHGRQPGERLAISDGTCSLSRADLDSAVSRCALRLARAGIRRGEPVLVQLPNQVELAVLVLAAIRLGAPPVLAVPALREHELDPVLETIAPVALAVPARQRRFDHLAMARRLQERHGSVRTLLVCGAGQEEDTGTVDLTAACRPGPGAEFTADQPADPSAVALYLLSSGTTGAPKLIPRTHEAFGHVIRTSAAVSGLGEDSVYLAVLPATHSFAFGHPGFLGTLARGGRVVLNTPDNPAGALSLVERERVTHCALAPALALQWLKAARAGSYDTSSLQVLQVGGARLDRATAQQLTEVLGGQVQQVYGMSEGLLNFTRLHDPDEVIAATQGRPASPGDEIVIVGEDGNPVPGDGIGELFTRGPSVITGYTGSASDGSFTAEGFYRTGDLVQRHPSGNLAVVGRTKDVINRGGEKIAADELEALVRTHQGVQAAAAVAMPHPVLGETVCLYLVTGQPGQPGLRELRRYLEDRGLAAFKLPERLVEVASLPVKGIGKVDKVALRADIAARLEAEQRGRPGPA